MAPVTQGGPKFNPAAVERVEWLAQRDLGAVVPGEAPQENVNAWQEGGGLDPPGHWRRYLRDAHPPRFRVPGGVEVAAVETAGSESFGATAAFGLRLPARTEAAFASLPGRPGWRCYVTQAGSAPAAAATYTDGPIVILAVDGSAEAGRRSAARAALLHRVIGDSIAAGARLIGARVEEEAEADGAQAKGADRDTIAGLLLAGFEKAYRCPLWVDAGLPAS